MSQPKPTERSLPKPKPKAKDAGERRKWVDFRPVHMSDPFVILARPTWYKQPWLTVRYYLHKWRRRLKNRRTRRRAWLQLAVILVAVIAVAGALLFWSHPATKPTASADSTTQSVPELPTGIPDYTTVLPKDKTAAALGGWRRVSPESASPVWAFVDKIGDAKVTVSEQPLPADFQANPEQSVSSLADGYKATAKITLGTMTIHLATYSDRTQTAIFTKSDLLILIQSNGVLSNGDWANYITNLN